MLIIGTVVSVMFLAYLGLVFYENQKAKNLYYEMLRAVRSDDAEALRESFAGFGTRHLTYREWHTGNSILHDAARLNALNCLAVLESVIPRQGRLNLRVKKNKSLLLYTEMFEINPAEVDVDVNVGSSTASDSEQDGGLEAIVASENQVPNPDRLFPNTNRNALCPCGSSLKYKKCHGRPAS